MDVGHVFRYLVTGKYIDDFDYSRKFTFRTVFYTSAYSYCCCPCGFEHEFLTYIRQNGEIDETPYGKIVESIILGRCPHVSGISDKWVTETSVSGLHIAIAVGNEQVENEKIENAKISDREDGIFKLSLHGIALARRKYKNLTWYYRRYTQNKSFDKYEDNDVILESYKHVENSNVFRTKQVTIFEEIVRTRNNQLLKDVLNHSDIHSYNWETIVMNMNSYDKVYSYIVKYGLFDLFQIVFDYEKQSEDIEDFKYAECATAAIMYNRVDILEMILDHVATTERKQFTFRELAVNCPLPCKIMRRSECELLLSKYGIDYADFAPEGKTYTLLSLLISYHDDFSEQIVAALKDIPDFQTFLHNISTDPREEMDVYTNPLVLKVLLDHVNNISIDIANFLLSVNLYNNNVREAIKLIIDTNPYLRALELGDAVNVGLSHDINKCNWPSWYFCKSIEYKTDVLEHGLFGFDGDDFALNFAGPFLMQ